MQGPSTVCVAYFVFSAQADDRGAVHLPCCAAQRDVLLREGLVCARNRTELLQRVQTIQRMVAEEPMYAVKPSRAGGGAGHKAREAAPSMRDPNLDAATAILQELENEHEFLCAPMLHPGLCSAHSCPLAAHRPALCWMQHSEAQAEVFSVFGRVR